MLTKKIYLAGGSPYELQEVFAHIRGVERATVGTFRAMTDGGETERIGAEIVYSPKKLDVSMILDILFAVISPYTEDQSADFQGEPYRSSVGYVSEEDRVQIEFCLNFMRNRGKPPAIGESHITVNDPNTAPRFARRFYARAMHLTAFCAAGEEHQNYLSKHPNLKTRIDFDKLKAYLDIWCDR